MWPSTPQASSAVEEGAQPRLQRALVGTPQGIHRANRAPQARLEWRGKRCDRLWGDAFLHKLPAQGRLGVGRSIRQRRTNSARGIAPAEGGCFQCIGEAAGARAVT
jgi:hypothetical protein